MLLCPSLPFAIINMLSAHQGNALVSEVWRTDFLFISLCRMILKGETHWHGWLSHCLTTPESQVQTWPQDRRRVLTLPLSVWNSSDCSGLLPHTTDLQVTQLFGNSKWTLECGWVGEYGDGGWGAEVGEAAARTKTGINVGLAWIHAWWSAWTQCVEGPVVLSLSD